MNRTPNPIAATVVLSIAAIAVYAGLRLYSPSSAPPRSATQPTAAEPTAAGVPDFSMPDLDGNDVSLRSWPGRPMIVNFWATWCAPCLREIPLLMDYQAAQPDVQIVGIAVDSEDAVRDFVAERPFSYPVLVGPRGYEAAAAFGAEYVALPLTVFVAADGRQLRLQMGEVHAEQLDEFTAAWTGLAAGALDFAAAVATMAHVP